jgi:hypothetical protein
MKQCSCLYYCIKLAANALVRCCVILGKRTWTSRQVQIFNPNNSWKIDGCEAAYLDSCVIYLVASGQSCYASDMQTNLDQ